LGRKERRSTTANQNGGGEGLDSRGCLSHNIPSDYNLELEGGGLTRYYKGTRRKKKSLVSNAEGRSKEEKFSPGINLSRVMDLQERLGKIEERNSNKALGMKTYGRNLEMPHCLKKRTEKSASNNTSQRLLDSQISRIKESIKKKDIGDKHRVGVRQEREKAC